MFRPFLAVLAASAWRVSFFVPQSAPDAIAVSRPRKPATAAKSFVGGRIPTPAARSLKQISVIQGMRCVTVAPSDASRSASSER